MAKDKLIGEDTGNIGEVGVDSGQVIVMDMSLIDRYVDNDMIDRRVYKHEDGTLLQYKSGGKIKLDKGAIGFDSYAHIIPKYGKTMNDINRDHEAEKVENELISDLSYAGACSTTLSGTGYGFLDGKSAFVTRTLYGDGGYETLNDGREITVNFNYSDGTDDDVEEEVSAGVVELPTRHILITDPCYISDGVWNGMGVEVGVNADSAEIIVCLNHEGGVVMIKVRPVLPKKV